MYEEMIRSILSELGNGSANIEASAFIFTDGLTIRSMLSVDIDDDRVGTMATPCCPYSGCILLRYFSSSCPVDAVFFIY